MQTFNHDVLYSYFTFVLVQSYFYLTIRVFLCRIYVYEWDDEQIQQRKEKYIMRPHSIVTIEFDFNIMSIQNIIIIIILA